MGRQWDQGCIEKREIQGRPSHGKVIVGGYDSNGNPAPYNLTFVLKSDQSISTEYNRERYKAKQKETREGRVS